MNTQKLIRIETLGCRLNQIESEAAGRFFLDNGFQVLMEGVTNKSEEDNSTLIYILNTCTVTQKAEQKARRLIRLILRKYPAAAIIVTGCYAQLAPEEIKAMDFSIAVIGGQIKSRISQIPVLLKDFLEKNEWNKIDFVKLIEKEICSPAVNKNGFPEQSFVLSATSFIAHSRASLKIQDGCNNSCSYCAIHMARGFSVSIEAQTAIDRVVELENLGHSEVVLTTVNIGQYKGKYKDGYVNFTGLLRLLLENTKTISFRISSLYPEVVTDEFCEVIKNKRVRPHFHLSVQSGSDSVLKLMNRAYKAEQVVIACEKLRKAKENPFIACDIITGFPGETAKDFEQTMELCHKCNFIWIHAFPFSERPGTPAATMPNKVPQSVSGERAQRLNDYAVNSKINYINSFVGKELEAIVETARKNNLVLKDNNQFIYHAVTENFLHVEIHTDKQITENGTVKVVIEKVNTEKIIKGGEIEATAKIIEIL
ncbi:MAG: tRNA (N(6)-L-threonylcarbamoyladenosine(37)-C(2))-methylthiotransferase MtaB [Treponema sp.]|nr:tRNA (N(6)-L-threonylcarbamoyladenosine(37)-C(2))-methylthiotransferase MtaB [Treponema sp.]